MKFFKAFIAWTQSFNSCIIGLEKRISELKDSVESLDDTLINVENQLAEIESSISYGFDDLGERVTEIAGAIEGDPEKRE